jgi:4-diphosphocytidyl-2-C-methyl-D-erythritol kinase
MKISSSTSRHSSLSLKAPAKINWFLKIINKRDDGYHDILSVMQCIAVYDTLEFESSDAVEVVSDLDIPPESNLVYKAASLLKQHTSYKKGIKITLQKTIPISAGLGGGSSDAAYTLLGLNKLWGLRLSREELCALGLKIGADVPFFLHGSPAIVAGRGEKIKDIDHHVSPFVLLLVKPPVDISTAWAYGLFDIDKFSELTKKPIDIKLFCHALEKRDVFSLSTMTQNDLENVVMEEHPVIEKIKKRMKDSGAIISLMTGSGPTVFGVFESKKTAYSAANTMGAHNWSCVTKTTVKMV